MANIGIATTWFERGAAYVSKAYEQVLAESHDVYIYARGGEQSAIGDPNWDLPNVTWAPRFHGVWKNSHNAVSVNHFWRWLKRNKIDLIIFNEERDWKLVNAISRLGYTVGAYIDYYTHDSVDQFKAYDFLLCNTQRHHSVFRNHQHAIFLQWGTDIDLYRPKGNEHGDRNGRNITFFHSAGWGGVNCRKGTDLVVKAFQRVSGNAALVIHSQVPLERFGESAQSILNDPRATLIQDTVPAPGLYDRGDVFVYPSRLEGIGLCIAEALACGLPVITTDSPPMNEFVKDGCNGKLVEVASWKERPDGYFWPESHADVEDLTAAMQYFVDHPKQLNQFQEAARKSAEDSFDWRKNAAKLPRILSRLCASGKKVRRNPKPAEVLSWYLRDMSLLAQRLVYRCARILPRPLAHFLNAPLRTLWRMAK